MTRDKTAVKKGKGRPAEHDRIDIAEKLVKWAKKDDSLNLCGFCSENDIDPTKISFWASESDDFRKAYNKAKTFIGNRREKKLSEGKLHQKAYDLNANTYDHFLKTERRDEKRFDFDLQKKMVEFMHSLKNEILDSVSQEVKDQYAALMNQITLLQAKK